MSATSFSTQDASAGIMAALTKSDAPRAVLVSLNRDGQLALVPVGDAQSLVNIKDELIDHLNGYPHSDEWLVGLRDYCDGRLAERSKSIPADRADLVLQASWEIDSIARMTLEYLPVDAETLIYRAMMRRCIRLASMVMSAIGEPNMDTPTLQSMFDDGEVNHG
jgi:hypothetical protein